ncbi:hypothetical protein M422DRAFT_23657 [Sphaerobolus stellatus SS14]|nr:hypothetical protein M422DRAFT_23657 [Sphaerobolus stellatus SS14]
MSPPPEGAGAALNPVLLGCAGLATAVATLVSCWSIYLHLKNYRKNVLQRMVIRIMLMIPIYGISSYISLFSLQAAFFIDAVRDIYEAFVIYVFFQLLIAYLGGERSLLILLHGRPPVHPLFPLNLFKRDLDASDPYTYLWLKRGILQYVQVKPILAMATIILKAVGKYDEGDLKAGSGYLYISIVYNISISIALYCLAMFWVVVNADLKPFRPVPKFLCVKGILFFSFWQSFFISILVAAGAIKHVGPYTEASYISLAITDLLICLEMPLFAIAHMYAFSHTDYISKTHQYAARMPLRYALRDAFGLKDVLEDTKATLHGEGMDYREFEPAEGKMHVGTGRDRRIRAGLRYARGGRAKYWLPVMDADTAAEAGAKRGGGTTDLNAVERARNRATGDDEEAYAPLFEEQARRAVRDETDDDGDDAAADGYSLTYSDPDTSEDELYEHSRGYLFGDYNYPCIDVSGEQAKEAMWEEEERILRDQRAAYFSPTMNPGRLPPGEIIRKSRGRGYGATDHGGRGNGKGKARHDLVDTDVDIEAQFRRDTGNLIDFESERASQDVEGAVRMKWTRKGNGAGKGTLISSPPHSSASASNSNSNSSSARASPRQTHKPPRPPLTASHSSTSHSHHSSPHLPPNTKALPPDAVDLIISDPTAEAEQITNERMRGEPALRAHAGEMRALRRVYRAGEGDDSGEEGADGGAGAGDVEERFGRDVLGEAEMEIGDVRVAREASPPAHARVLGGVGYAPEYEEDNPWAR